MVAVEPDLGNIFKLPVPGDFLWRQVVVVVNDGEVFGVSVIEATRKVVAKEEVVVKEGLIMSVHRLEISGEGIIIFLRIPNSNPLNSASPRSRPMAE